ncbi:MAG: hypothetical protein AAF583_01555 [Pseudomonadota bacterium]
MGEVLKADSPSLAGWNDGILEVRMSDGAELKVYFQLDKVKLIKFDGDSVFNLGLTKSDRSRIHKAARNRVWMIEHNQAQQSAVENERKRKLLDERYHAPPARF